ncbi:hypothetical protein DXB25_15970 [Lachnospiraceae bacterium OM02-31]|nr:hypothetical protein DXB25_15970 [Lachnospiraceae bacterium OM02-31]RJW58211.1 hypothetical protein DXB24_06075 [Lachnospiraceae bacterium OM02-3]
MTPLSGILAGQPSVSGTREPGGRNRAVREGGRAQTAAFTFSACTCIWLYDIFDACVKHFSMTFGTRWCKIGGKCCLWEIYYGIGKDCCGNEF